MTEEELKIRCKKMALRVIQLVMSLPKNSVSGVLGYLLFKGAVENKPGKA